MANINSLPDGPSPAGRPGLVTFDSESTFEDQLSMLASENKLPAILKVHTAHEPFQTDSHQGLKGWHFITIRILAYNQASGTVTLDNQWGKNSHHSVSVSELYRATMAPSNSAGSSIEAEDKKAR